MLCVNTLHFELALIWEVFLQRLVQIENEGVLNFSSSITACFNNSSSVFTITC